MVESWTILYNNALQSDSPQLLEKIATAYIAMHARLRTLLLGSQPSCEPERRSLYVGLADLRVLRVSYRAKQRLLQAEGTSNSAESSDS